MNMDMKGIIITNEQGNLEYHYDGMKIELFRYTDPDRLNLADSAAIYLGKPDTDNIKRPLNIMKMGHALEVFRAESATFKFYGVPKQVYDHLVTYKTLQARIAGGNRALVSDTYTMPSDRMKDPVLVEAKLKQAHDAYMDLIEAGETGQVARSAMPVNANMNPFKLQFNFQTLIESLFVQRIFELGAQGRTVDVVEGMFWLCHAVDPELWEQVYELYGPHVKEWKDVQKKLRRKQATVREFFLDASKKAGLDEGTDMFAYFADKPLEQILRQTYGVQKTMW
jgi:Thymidylate synthase complementing protein